MRVQRARPQPGLAGVLLQFLLCPVSRSAGACALCPPAQVGQGPGQIATCQHAVLSGGLAEVSGGCATTGAKFLLQSWGPERLMDQVLLGHRPGPGIRSEFTLMGFISGSGEPPSPVWAALSRAWWAVRARGMRAEGTGIWCLGWRTGRLGWLVRLLVYCSSRSVVSQGSQPSYMVAQDFKHKCSRDQAASSSLVWLESHSVSLPLLPGSGSESQAHPGS